MVPPLTAIVVVELILLVGAQAGSLALTSAPLAAPAIAARRIAHHQPATLPTLSLPIRRTFKVECLRPVTAASQAQAGILLESEAAPPDELLSLLSLAHALVVPDLLQHAMPAVDGGAPFPAPNALRRTANALQKRLFEIQDRIIEIGLRLASQHNDEAVIQGAEIVAAAIETATDVLNGRRDLPSVTHAEADPICAFQKRLIEALGVDYALLVVLKEFVQNPLRFKLLIAVNALKLIARSQ